MALAPRLAGAAWSILHSAVVRAWGLSSEVLVAAPARTLSERGLAGELLV
jgi:hypothetical protein